MIEFGGKGGMMMDMLTPGEQRLDYLIRALPANEKLYLWCYNRKGQLIAASNPDDLLPDLFVHLGAYDKMRAAADRVNTRPLLIGSAVGMQWVLIFQQARNRELMFVIGPVFYQQPDADTVRRVLLPVSSRPKEWIQSLLSHLDEMPVLSFSSFIRYAVMLHNALNNDQLGLDAFMSTDSGEKEITISPDEHRDLNQVYQAENILLTMVRTGDINYRRALQHSINISPGVPVHGKDPLRQAKTSLVVFTTLVSRAAMEGGLSPEIAYPLNNSYIQSIENCFDSGELSALASAMYHDFIYHVHRLHANPNYSQPIQRCCDYIELGLDKKLEISSLAALVGYSDYYLTEKFKKETGQSIHQYIKKARINRAKMLLLSTNQSIQQIADHLAFATPNYFIRCFREEEGVTPAQFRKQK